MNRLLLALLLLIPASLSAQEMTHRYFHDDQHFIGGPHSIGTDSLTDGADAMYFTDGTIKGVIRPTASYFRITAVSNHSIALGVNDTTEAYLTSTAFAPGATGGNALGTSSLGWNGLHLSDGTDKWSLIPGTNLLTLAAGTADGADDQGTYICSGGECLAGRGAFLQVWGNEHAGLGILALNGGSNATNGGAGSVRMQPRGALAWEFSGGGNLTQDVTNGGNIVMAKTGTGILAGLTAVPGDLVATIGSPNYTFLGNITAGAAYIRGVDSAASTGLHLFKSRKTDGTADTIVTDNDSLGMLRFWGADGASFVSGAYIEAKVDGTPGLNDMPTELLFYTTPDGGANSLLALTITPQGTTLVRGVTVASLPASCAPGSLIRATDSNDCAAGGGNGAMCICTAAGAWALLSNY